MREPLVGLKGTRFYLAGPMSGLPDFNYPAFRAAAKRLREYGLVIASPHERWDNESEQTRAMRPADEYMKHSVGLMLRCDSIILLRGWSRSRGAYYEMQLALELRYSVYYYTPAEESPLLELV